MGLQTDPIKSYFRLFSDSSHVSKAKYSSEGFKIILIPDRIYGLRLGGHHLLSKVLLLLGPKLWSRTLIFPKIEANVFNDVTKLLHEPMTWFQQSYNLFCRVEKDFHKN